MTAIVILSGGVDSTTLLHFIKDCYPDMELTCLTFNYGQKHKKEIGYAMYQAALFDLPHIVMDITGISISSVGSTGIFSKMWESSALVGEDEVPDMKDVEGDPQPPTYVPNRNMTFLSLAAGFAEQIKANRVFYGAQAHDMYGYWDCTPKFVNNLNSVFRLNRKAPVTIEAPFIHKSKPSVVAIGLKLGVDYTETWSCYKGGDLHCGLCPTCAERLNAFNQNNIVDPVEYEIQLDDVV